MSVFGQSDERNPFSEPLKTVPLNSSIVAITPLALVGKCSRFPKLNE